MSQTSFAFGDFLLGEGSVLTIQLNDETSLSAQFKGMRNKNKLLFHVYSSAYDINGLVKIGERVLNHGRENGTISVVNPKPPFERANQFSHDYYDQAVNSDGSAVTLPSLDEEELAPLHSFN